MATLRLSMIEIIGYVALSFALIGFYRWLALRYRWLDHPNQRSSHVLITPRGAGIVFSLFIITTTSWHLYAQHIPFTPILAGAAIALAGWWDDIRGCASQIRLAIYATVAISASLSIVYMPNTDIIEMGLIALLGGLGVTWLINLYNFMDGINGLATLEAIFVLSTIVLLDHNTVYGHAFSHIHIAAAAILAGFLLWNFPAGKIFMGDAGSAFLGFFLGVLAIWSHQLQGPPIAVWLILLALFISDTSYTLCARIATRQKWYEAHRLHAYQKLTARLNANHARTTGLLMLVNLCWLLPIAWLVQTHALHQIVGLTLAYLPLLVVGYWLKAGIPQEAEV